jgi:hypothetical protein
MANHRYWSSNCKGCALKDKCTPSQQRRVTRWEHQDVLEEMQAHLEQNPDAMRIRRSSVEHPYGTIKSWMGSTHFLTKGLERVKTEMSLHVLAYNLKRLMTVLGIANMMEAIRAYALLLALQRVFAAATLLVWPQMPKNGDSAHNALSTAELAHPCTVLLPACVFEFLHSLGRKQKYR